MKQNHSSARLLQFWELLLAWIQDGESFLRKELKYARRWLYAKGVALPTEDRNPVEVQMESFFDWCRTGSTPKADVEVGLANSAAVILSNLAMD